MPRRKRLQVAGLPLHIIQRGNNRQACFFADEDYQCYLNWLKAYAESTGCLAHAYVLMTNHVPLLISVDRADSAGALMKALGRRTCNTLIAPTNAAGRCGRNGFGQPNAGRGLYAGVSALY